MVGIILIASINQCPYLKNYVACLDELSIPYDLIFWERSSTIKKEDYIENSAQHSYVFQKQSNNQKSPIFKVVDFYLFSKYVKKIIKREKYEKLIVLTTMAGMIIKKEICSHYKGQYIFDYRDASYEWFKPFRSRLNKIINNSAFTCISSMKFSSILKQKYDYIVAHNISTFETCNIVEKNHNLKIIIGYIGGLRETSYMKKLVDIFRDDDRFEFMVYGGGDNYGEMVTYSQNSKNVRFTGYYKESAKPEIINGVDVICYNYESSFVNDLALANKFYDGLLFRKPMLGNWETYSGKLICEYGVGISLDFRDCYYKDKIYQYYHDLDMASFEKKCDELLCKIKKEQEYYIEKIKQFLCNR